ncbi:hypothetical protein RJT34_01741 [Clitoria ternatea]|uniref:Core Histone H2A/H2B/H3 domain-containing protein n=1 Tax=Clitoria ternatea TaxID=43366 RepID=A0AAN9KH11_CLITE
MDQNQQNGQPGTGTVTLAQEANGRKQHQVNIGSSASSSSNPIEQQHAIPPEYMYQIQQEQLVQQLNNLWTEIEDTTDSRTHSLPFARIKKVMKANEGVSMVSAEAPVLFAKAIEMFILELTLRARIHAEENKRRTLQRSDIAAAISETDVFDFLVDVVPREETMKHDEVFVGIPRGDSVAPKNFPHYYVPPHQHAPRGGSVAPTGNFPRYYVPPYQHVPRGSSAAPTENFPYYYMPPHQHVPGARPTYGAPRMVVEGPPLDQAHNGQPAHPLTTKMWLNPKCEDHSPIADD